MSCHDDRQRIATNRNLIPKLSGHIQSHRDDIGGYLSCAAAVFLTKQTDLWPDSFCMLTRQVPVGPLSLSSVPAMEHVHKRQNLVMS